MKEGNISEIMLLTIFQEKFRIMVFVRVGRRCMGFPVARGLTKEGNTTAW